MLSSVLSHVHTPWPPLSAVFCPGCSGLLDWFVVWQDARKEVS